MLYRGLYIIPDHPDFATKRGNHSFARVSGDLRSACRINDDLFAGINLSANSLRDQIRKLLSVFAIPENEMIIYLRRDLDATSDIIRNPILLYGKTTAIHSKIWP